MASTINASTSAGIIQTADTSGVLALQSGGTTALTINTTGSVAFGTSASAYGTSGQILTSNGNAVPTWQAPPASMIYPGAGVAVSNGSAWGTSLVAASANTANALVQRDGSGNFSAGSITGSNFSDATGTYNVNLGSGGSAGRGVVAGYSGGSYGGLGYNVTHTATGGVYTAPTSDTSSYLRFGSGGMQFLGAAAGAAGRTLSYTSLATLDVSGNLSLTGTISAVGGTMSGTITSSASSLIIGTSGGIQRGYLYNDSAGFGILTNGGSWGARLDYGTTNWWCAGNITAYSDERVKTNWRELQSDFIEQLAKVKHGIYDRTDQVSTQVGVGAQSLLPVMEHAVTKDSEGNLSVAYGNAALVAAIKLAESVVELKSQVATLEAKLEQLTKDKS